VLLSQRLVILLMVFLALLPLAGCGLPANPKTRIGVGPFGGWSFENSKDVAILLKNAHANVKDGSLDIEELQIEDNASAVRKANVEQLQAYTEQVRAVTLMFQQMTDAIAAIIPQSVHRPSGGAMPPGWQTVQPNTEANTTTGGGAAGATAPGGEPAP